MENDELDENSYFEEVTGEFAGHGYGNMVLLKNDQEDFAKWVFFHEEATNKVEILDPDLYDLYLEWGNLAFRL